ncbi:MAG: hypothetical protein AAGG01_19695, partial [Planctomycetota bacterium]
RPTLGLKPFASPLDDHRVMTQPTTVCIECGGPANALNEDESGDPCPACAERLLETLPGVFHSPWGGQQVDETVEGDSDSMASAEESQERPPAGGFGEPRGSA